MKKAKKSVSRQVRTLEARDLFSVTGGCGCSMHRPPILTGQPTFPPPRPGKPAMPPGAQGLPSFPPRLISKLR
jgi:hypothetical protein